ncbi:MAG: response regulator [candidate division KSB1 bacterium]|nr:response regulator [candidate division KSB1 bacterium]
MGLRVLIADDSDVMRKIILRNLRLAGYAVDKCYEARHGFEALYHLSKDDVDLILSDINMPEMDGLEFIRKVRQMPLSKRVPIIVITSEGSQQMVREAVAAGADGFIVKPFTPEKLQDRLQQVLR